MDLTEAFHKGYKLLLRIVLIKDAVDPETDRQLFQKGIIGFLDEMLHMARNVKTGNLLLVPLQKPGFLPRSGSGTRAGSY